MIWHIVRFDFTGIDPAARGDLEDRLTGLEALDEVAWLRLAHDIADPDVTGLITVFEDEEDLRSYRDNPEHVPVVAALEAAGVGTARIDMETEDDARDMP